MSTLIDLKDIAGLSAPLVKLIETINAGGGRVSDGISRLANAYFLAKRDAGNEAQRIRLVEETKTQIMVDRVKSLAALQGSDGPLLQTLDITQEELTAHLAETPAALRGLRDRSTAYSAYQNAWRHINREAVMDNAAAALDDEGEMSQAPVNPTVAARILDIAQDISDEAAQTLWGHILAGEVKQPGSFSLRTLDILRNLSPTEAQYFKKAADFTLRNQGSCFISLTPLGLSNEILGNFYEFKYAHIISLVDCGLILPGQHRLDVGIPGNGSTEVIDSFRIADHVVFLEAESNIFSIGTFFVFSPAGNQLYKLIAKESRFSLSYLTNFIAPLRKKGVRVKYGRLVTELPDRSFTYESPLLELTD